MIPKKVVLIGISILVLSIIGYKYFSRSEDSPYDFAVVEKGNVVQLVSVAGQVIPNQKIVLQFEIAGKIKDIQAETGDEVETNDILATLETFELNAQAAEARAAQDLAQAKLDKLLAGASKEEIQIAETKVFNAEIGLENDKQNLEDVKAEAEEDLNNAYEDAINTLDEAYLKLYNAYNFVDELQEDYFSGSYSGSLKVKTSKEKIKNSLNRAKTYIDLANNNPNNDNIDKTLLELKNDLDITEQELAVIRDVCDESFYSGVVSSADKTSLDNHKSYILTAYTNIVNDQQTISSTKITNETNINRAESTVANAQGSLQKAKDELALTKAEPRQVDVDLAQAELDQAQASLLKANQQLTKAKLIAVIDGKITNIFKEAGEVASIGEPIISLIGQGKFQIEVDIPETDIGKIELQNPSKIILDAFPEQEFEGKIIEIEPAETIIQGVVYYKVKLSLEAENNKIKPGMTANVDITSQVKENVLKIPQRAVITENGQKFVRALSQNQEIKKILVEIGLKGSQGEIEIISGLEVGNEVITFIKEK